MKENVIGCGHTVFNLLIIPGLSLLCLLFLFLFLVPADSFATNPPMKNLPEKHWQIAQKTAEQCVYGDAGWVERMRRRKEASLAKALGKPSQYLILDQDELVIPVILAAYSDEAITLAGAQAAFQNALFDNASGTITAYYNEISYGTLSVTGTVVAPVTTGDTRANYVAAGSPGYVTSAVTAADAAVDFSQYDNDGSDGNPNSGDDDGYVDAVVIIYPGRGADVGDATNFNAHMSNLSTAYTTNDAANGGGFIKIQAYTVQSEFRSDGATIRDVGVFVHELGHVLGLPDLYDRNGGSEGVGEWSVMGSGSHGGDGAHPDTPAHMDAWCKIQMGWLTATNVTENTSITVDQAETNAEAFIVYEDPYYWSRYYLIENRQKTGFDLFLNGPGMLIYHIDENMRWGNGYFNATGLENDDENHKMMDVEAADGNADMDNEVNRGDAGDPWPGSANKITFNDASTPNTKDYDGNSTGISISNISASGAAMTANVTIREKTGYAIVYDEDGIRGGWGDNTAADEWSGVLFTATQKGTLNAIDLGLREDNTNYVIQVYGSFDGTTPSNLLTTADGSAAALSNGWNTISIPGNVSLSAGQTFFVSARIIGKNYGTSFDATGTNNNKSYFSSNGTTFNAFTAANQGDMNIRARIGLPPSVPSSGGGDTGTDISAGDVNTVTVSGNTWSMISLPVVPSGSATPQALFSDDIEPFHTLSYNSNIYNYSESSNSWDIPSLVQNGLGYILFGFETGSIDVPGSIRTGSLARTLTKSEGNGWHLLGNPFGVSIDWDDNSEVTRGTGVDNIYYRWTGSQYQYYPGGGLTKDIGIWQGIWVHTSTDGAQITFTYPSSSKEAKPQIQETENPWKIQIIAESGKAHDTFNFAGISESASFGFDGSDVYELMPLNTEFVSLYFPHEEWETNPGDYTQDMRPPALYDGGIREEWNMSVAAKSSVDHVRLSWIEQENPYLYDELLLVDEERNITIDMRANNEYIYSIEPASEKSLQKNPEGIGANPQKLLFKYGDANVSFRNFKIVMNPDRVTEISENQVVPDEFILHQNFPNPFNPSTTIEYGLPGHSNISLIIYNILGQEVRRLVEGQQNAGIHRVMWDGRDENGADVASGVYLYRLSAEGNHSIRKLLLIR